MNWSSMPLQSNLERLIDWHSWPSSTPCPDCFAPKKGTSGMISRWLLIQTVPAWSRRAASSARLGSDDQTVAQRP